MLGGRQHDPLPRRAAPLRQRVDSRRARSPRRQRPPVDRARGQRRAARGRPRRGSGGRRRGGRARRSAAAARERRVLVRRAAAHEDDAAARRARLDRRAPRLRPADRLEHDVVVGEPLGRHRAERRGLRAAVRVRSARVTVRPSATSSAASIWPIGAAEHAGVRGERARRPPRDRVHRRRQRLGHRRARGIQPVGHGVERRLRRGDQLREAAEDPARIAADLRPAGRAGAAGAHATSRRRAPARRCRAACRGLVAEPRRVRRQDRVPGRHLFTSVPHVVAASTLTSTSPSPTGSGTSSTRRSPGPCSIAARIRAGPRPRAPRRPAARRAPRRSPRARSGA